MFFLPQVHNAWHIDVRWCFRLSWSLAWGPGKNIVLIPRRKRKHLISTAESVWITRHRHILWPPLENPLCHCGTTKKPCSMSLSAMLLCKESFVARTPFLSSIIPQYPTYGSKKPWHLHVFTSKRPSEAVPKTPEIRRSKPPEAPNSNGANAVPSAFCRKATRCASSWRRWNWGENQIHLFYLPSFWCSPGKIPGCWQKIGWNKFKASSLAFGKCLSLWTIKFQVGLTKVLKKQELWAKAYCSIIIFYHVDHFSDLREKTQESR